MGSSTYSKYFNHMETMSNSNKTFSKAKKRGAFAIDMNPNGELEVFLNSKYTIDKDNKYFEAMPLVIDLIN